MNSNYLVKPEEHAGRISSKSRLFNASSDLAEPYTIMY